MWNGSGAFTPAYVDDDEGVEPPILEELGINPEEIGQRVKSVLLFEDIDKIYLCSSDMVGPLVALILLALFLVLNGKFHFSYLYALGIGGSIGSFVLLNLMSQSCKIDFHTTISILGYSLIPMDLLAMLSIFLPINGAWWGIVIGLAIVTWSTATSSRSFEKVLQMHHQRYLVAYPLFLFYSAFALMATM